MRTPSDRIEASTRRFAWDGFSFDAPSTWDLAHYTFDRRTAGLRMEDETAVRLDLEWMRPPVPMDAARVRQRYAKVTAEWSGLAETVVSIEGLPEGWIAVHYLLPGGRSLVVAYWPAPRTRFFCALRLHFGPVGRRKPVRIAKDLIGSFVLHETDSVPWVFYDVSLHIHRRFRLVRSSLQAGQKLMVFEWRLRQLYLWQFSLAHLLLKGRAPEAWAAEFLGHLKEARAATFSAGPHGRIESARKRRYPIGRYEEIGRWCFHYQAECRHVADQNMLQLLLFNFRSESDRATLGGRRGQGDDLLSQCFAARRGKIIL